MLRETWRDYLSDVTCIKPGQLYRANNNGGRRCVFGNQHDVKPLVVYVRGNDLFAKCISNLPCGAKENRGAWIGVLRPGRRQQPIVRIQHTEELRFTPDCLQAMASHGHLLTYDAPEVTPWQQHASDTAAIADQAACGVGKTQAVVDALRQHPELRRCLFITTRRFLATTLLGRLQGLGFRHYSELDHHQMQRADRLIIQYESLHKLQGRELPEPFDLVAIDECESLMENCLSVTNRQFMVVNALLFEVLHKSARRVWWMDADLSTTSLGALRILLGDSNVLLRINKHRKFHRNIVVHRCEACWLQTLRAEVAAGECTFVCWGSKQRALEVMQTEPWNGKEREQLTFYYGGCGQERMNDFLDLDASWDLPSHKHIWITGAVTVGASRNKPHARKVFVHACPLTWGPRIAMQMEARLRAHEDCDIDVFVQQKHRPKNPLPTDLAVIREEMRVHGDIVLRADADASLLRPVRPAAASSIAPDQKRVEPNSTRKNKKSKDVKASEQRTFCPDEDELRLQARRPAQVHLGPLIQRVHSAETNRLELAPTWLNHVIAHVTQERNAARNDWLAALIEHAKHVGFSLTYHTCPEHTKEDIKRHKAEVKLQRDAVVAEQKRRWDALSELQIDPDTGEPTADARVAIDKLSAERATASEDDQLLLTKWFHQWIYGSSSYDHYRLCERKKHIINQAALSLRVWPFLVSPDVARKQQGWKWVDNNDCHQWRGRYAEMAKLLRPRVKFLLQICDVLRLRSPVDTETVVHSTQLIEPAAAARLQQLFSDKELLSVFDIDLPKELRVHDDAVAPFLDPMHCRPTHSAPQRRF